MMDGSEPEGEYERSIGSFEEKETGKKGIYKTPLETEQMSPHARRIHTYTHILYISLTQRKG